MNTGISKFSVPMMYQQHFPTGRDMQASNLPSQNAPRYHRYPNNREQEEFSRVVFVPPTNVRKVYSHRDETVLKEHPAIHSQNNGSVPSGTMDLRSIGHRQPIEHPNDKPAVLSNGTYEYPGAGSSGHDIVHGVGRMSIHTPPQHARHSNPPQVHSTQQTLSNTPPMHMTQAMMQSKQRVAEWESRPPSSGDTEESFVIDGYTDTLRSDLSLSESESYRGPSRPPYRSSSFPNSSARADRRPPFHGQRNTIDDLQSMRSGYGDYDELSDDDTNNIGFVKSLSCIQKPPEVDTCSRQNSNGSQSSLESNLSFHTVYPSGFDQQKMTQHKPPERSRRPQQAATPAPTEPHPQSTRHQATASTEPYLGRSQSQPGLCAYTRAPSEQSSGVRQINEHADEASREGNMPKRTSVFITYAEEQNDKNFKKLVLQLTRTLLSNGIQVRLDMLESTLMSMSVSTWLDDNIEKCDFVVMCVSPSYKSEVEQQNINATPDPHSLHTKYIYQRLLTQYIQNGSLNYRFIPVLMGGATRRDLPSLCQDTHVYEWPKDFEAIIYRLFKKEKYIQPKVGPPPKCTVETYDSYDERFLNG